jgi:hypothetical protein
LACAPDRPVLIPCIGQAHATRGPVEQCNAQFLLQQTHLPAERGLRHPHHPRRLGQRTILSDADKIAEPPDLHPTSFLQTIQFRYTFMPKIEMEA